MKGRRENKSKLGSKRETIRERRKEVKKSRKKMFMSVQK